MIKVRKQIYLDQSDIIILEKDGRHEKKSVSEMIRDAIKEYIKRKKNKHSWKDDPLSLAVGKFSSSGPAKDLSENHDKYLYDKT